ncbi:MAG: DNA polymerase IV [Chitinophagia bacterium]|jgi:DNA polymerase-4
MLMHQTYIAHFDLDAFFVSVERILDPSLEGKALILGGSRERGVVSTCSYEARKFGVRSAMPMARAVSLCPHAIVMKGSRGQYGKFSQWVTDIIAAKAPLFEKASIDEFYVDLTGMDRFFDPLQWTIDLRTEIMEKTRLPISFGLASNKMVAKMATNAAKPNGYLQVMPGKEKEFLAPFPVGDIPGVGEHTLKSLNSLGILSIEDLSSYPVNLLEQYFGKYGEVLSRKAIGDYEGSVHTDHESKSISTEHTFFENTGDVDFLLNELKRMTEKIGHELRGEKRMTRCVAVKIRYPDFQTHTRQLSIQPTSFDDEIIKVVRELFHQLYDGKTPLRLIGVRFSELIEQHLQTDLFQNKLKKDRLYQAIDVVKKRFGKGSVGRG